MREQQKVTASHLARKAYLYVRQSSPRQVLENRESTQRQYGLRERAVALGWGQDQVVVIDRDLGQSASPAAADREGFQQLVAEVGMGRAGIVLGLEVSRLARNSSEWHRLLEICALTQTLLLDEDGLYDPAHFNDRILLGLKGTMSEAELHVLQARLQGGALNKARRGELQTPLPIGLLYGPDGRVTLDPDRQVQEVLHRVFSIFHQLRSASATAKELRNQGIRMPRRERAGPGKGELFWVEARAGMVVQALRNPRYAGAYFFGSRRQCRLPGGRQRTRHLPQEEWRVLIPQAHVGYISWDQYQENLRYLRENSNAHDKGGWRYPPREGPALLQGIAICGVCGSRMMPRYTVGAQNASTPYYTCSRVHTRHGGPLCQHIAGMGIDQAISDLLLETLTPLSLEAALAVQSELQSRLESSDRLRRLQVERAQYDVDLARRRYMQVDPDNRLVADSLEADWNTKLRSLRECQEEYERQRAADQEILTDDQLKAVRALASDFPAIWNQTTTSHQERKRMVRLLIEDVTLLKDDQITMHVRFRGGATRSLSIPLPRNAWQARQTPPELVRLIDELLDEHTEAQVVRILNERKLLSGGGKRFKAGHVREIRDSYGLKSRAARLEERGFLTVREVAERLGITPDSVTARRRSGRLKGHAINDKGEYLYEPPEPGSEYRPRATSPEVIELIDELLNEHTEEEIARLLNERGLLSGEGKTFTRGIVKEIRRNHGLESRYHRLRRRGLLTAEEVGHKLGITPKAVMARHRRGTLKAYRTNDRGKCLFPKTAPTGSRGE